MVGFGAWTAPPRIYSEAVAIFLYQEWDAALETEVGLLPVNALIQPDDIIAQISLTMQ